VLLGIDISFSRVKARTSVASTARSIALPFALDHLDQLRGNAMTVLIQYTGLMVGGFTVFGSTSQDYTTNTATEAFGPVTLNTGSPATTATFTNFTLTPGPAGSYTLTSTGTTGTSGIAQLQFTWTGQTPGMLDSATIQAGGSTFSTLSNNEISSIVVCFAAGTLIRTPKGDVAVERLQAGDLVVTSSGEQRPIKWIGHRDTDLRRRHDRRSHYPVRIAADAFGPNRPSKDLYVSAGHAICIDLCGEVLIHASQLVNGSTVAQVEMDEVSYWHVELDSHDVILANNLPAESYLALGNRRFFEEARVDALQDGRGRTYADFCRPVVLDGTVLDFVRQRLEQQAEALGWAGSRKTDLHLMVEGKVRHPLEEGEAAVFLFPANARDVRLRSNTFVPARVGPSGDNRELGFCVRELSFSGRGEPRSIPLDDERLKDGFHLEEASAGAAWRWSRGGELVLDSGLWEGLSGEVALFIACDNGVIRRWDAPVSEREVQARDGRPALYAVR
jgi:hypothetical protein